MPASAGRVRMPHNNRMSTSASLKSTSIWQKTIGHDPYAGDNEPDKDPQKTQESTEKARQVMELARQQNVTGEGADRDDFALKLYLGLKKGKQRRQREPEGNDRKLPADVGVEINDSSSEEEFVVATKSSESRKAVDDRRHRKKKASKKRKRKRHRKHSGSSSSSSSDESSEKRRRKRHKRKRKHRRRDSSSSDSESSGSDDDERRKKHRKKEKRRKEKRRENEVGFIAADSYNGAKRGYYFRSGGYYKDEKPKIDQQALDEIVKWAQE